MRKKSSEAEARKKVADAYDDAMAQRGLDGKATAQARAARAKAIAQAMKVYDGIANRRKK